MTGRGHEVSGLRGHGPPAAACSAWNTVNFRKIPAPYPVGAKTAYSFQIKAIRMPWSKLMIHGTLSTSAS